MLLATGTEEILVARQHPIWSITLTLLLSGHSSVAQQARATAQPTREASEVVKPQAMVRLPTTIAGWAHGAFLFDGLGDTHRAITTTSPEAQKYFDQGLRLMWAFNHDEATRSFAKAVELDPACASCYWGVSLTVGPNYNLPFLSADRARVAFGALQRAQNNASHSSAVEQALIAALAVRYPSDRPLDADSALPILTAYADAMQRVARQFPEDLDVETLYSESLMNLHAWKLWTPDGKPTPGTTQIVSALESVLARDPKHPGANHYYIHALEASAHPEQALVAAERVKTLMPAAGHLLHMPAHILQRVGRYEEAAEANRHAAVADAAYDARTHPPDYYPVVYTAHNYQFLAYSAAMEGRQAETIDAVNHSRQTVSDEMLLAMPGMDWYVAESYAARVRFGLWQEMLALPAPNPRLTGLTAGFLYGRAVALAATGHAAEARAELDKLQRFAATVPGAALAGQNTVKDVLAVAIPITAARIATAERRSRDAVALLREAVTAEDRLAYDEPSDWFFPARHLLGAELLRSGAAPEAERVYREDLLRSPMNGWSLYGLATALKAQGKDKDAVHAAQQFTDAWKHSDVRLTASAF